MGGDFSLPVTATSSVYGTIHPDFSNVEVDQQSISPTAYQRSYNEVRPFFTQGANYYERFSCSACPGISQLYTPAIPTPRDGYAFEGKQGRISFAAFDAVGNGRTDGAAAVTARSPDNHWHLTAQTVAANLPRITDHVDTTGISYNDAKHVSAYFNYGTDPRDERPRREPGEALRPRDVFLHEHVRLRRVGAQSGTVLRAGRWVRAARRHRRLCAL
jgi:hypothetical protein